jgi:hypothetical protein
MWVTLKMFTRTLMGRQFIPDSATRQTTNFQAKAGKTKRLKGALFQNSKEKRD